MKKIAVFLMVIFCGMLLSGCVDENKAEEVSHSIRTSRVIKDSIGAIKAESSNTINLSGGNILLPSEYQYSILKNEDLTTYFVFNPDKCNEIADKRDGRSAGEYEALLKEEWNMAKEDALKNVGGKEELLSENLKGDFVFDTDAYITPYHENNTMIIYEGIDRATPNMMLTNKQMNVSFYTYFRNSVMGNLTVRNTQKKFGVPYPTLNVDVEKVPEMNKWLYDEELNGKYYVYTVTTNSGKHITTTYNEQCYPHTYYCVYLMEKESFDGSFRRWYAFIFCNDSEGNFLSEKNYNDIMNQIKGSFGVSLFPTSQYNKDAKNYDAEWDTRDGLNYQQLEKLFHFTNQYYIISNNLTRNIDDLTDEEVKKDDSITEVKFN